MNRKLWNFGRIWNTGKSTIRWVTQMNKYVLCHAIFFLSQFTQLWFLVEYLQEAVQDYTSCLRLVPFNNLSLKRDVLEGIARCYIHLGKNSQALEICEKLVGYSISCMCDSVWYFIGTVKAFYVSVHCIILGISYKKPWRSELLLTMKMVLCFDPGRGTRRPTHATWPAIYS